MLVVVESPNKVKKIQEFLGKDYEVVATKGHFRDLDKKHNGYLPETWEIISGKQSVITALKKSYKRNSSNIILATDPDREGEAIAWHVCEILGIHFTKAIRCRFNEITKDSVCNAVHLAETEHSQLDMDLVYAQRARRLLDRRIGYSSTRHLWRVIGGGVSAGRCLIPAANILDELSKEQQSKGTRYVIRGNITTPMGNATLNEELDFTDLSIEDNITDQRILLYKYLNTKYDDIKGRTVIDSYLRIVNIKKTRIHKSPPSPLSTSSLLTLNGGSPQTTMNKLQRLFEKGLITYHRTDSTMLSEEFVNSIRKEHYDNVSEKHKKKHVHFTDDKKCAHEAIRPTNWKLKIIDDEDLQHLYNIIWQHSVGSIFPEWIGEKTTFTFNHNWKLVLERTIEIDEGGMCGGGWLGFVGKAPSRTYGYPIDDLHEGSIVKIINGSIKLRKEHRGKSINESYMVKALEMSGIGRPSTYSTIIEHLSSRGYVESVERKNSTLNTMSFVNNSNTDNTLTYSYDDLSSSGDVEDTTVSCTTTLQLSDVGRKCINELQDSLYSSLFKITYTADMEKILDTIADGKIKWSDFIMEINEQLDLIEKRSKTRSKIVSTYPQGRGAFPETILGETDTHKYGKGRTRYGPVIWREPHISDDDGKFKRQYNKVSAKRWSLVTFETAVKSFQTS